MNTEWMYRLIRELKSKSKNFLFYLFNCLALLACWTQSGLVFLRLPVYILNQCIIAVIKSDSEHNQLYLQTLYIMSPSECSLHLISIKYISVCPCVTLISQGKECSQIVQATTWAALATALIQQPNTPPTFQHVIEMIKIPTSRFQISLVISAVTKNIF